MSARNLHNAASILRGPEVRERRVEAVRKLGLRCVWELNLQPTLLNDEPGLGCPAEQKAAECAKRPPPDLHLLTWCLQACTVTTPLLGPLPRFVNPAHCTLTNLDSSLPNLTLYKQDASTNAAAHHVWRKRWLATRVGSCRRRSPGKCLGCCPTRAVSAGPALDSARAVLTSPSPSLGCTATFLWMRPLSS